MVLKIATILIAIGFTGQIYDQFGWVGVTWFGIILAVLNAGYYILIGFLGALQARSRNDEAE